MTRLAIAAAITATCAGCWDGGGRAEQRLPQEAYLIVYVDARQPGVDGFPGAVFRFDPAAKSLARFASDPRFVDPEQCLVQEDGSILLVDAGANPDERDGQTGAVFVLDGKTGTVVRVLSPPEFVMPVSIAKTAAGDVLVVDRAALPGKDGRKGAVFALDVAAGSVRPFASDAAFRAPAYAAADRDGSTVVLDADARAGSGSSEGALFRIAGPGGTITRMLDLDGTVSPLTILREPESTWLVFDANADPGHRGGPAGGVFRADPIAKTTMLVCADARLRDPVRGCFAANGSVLFVDANADVEKSGPDPANRGQNATGPGALFRLDRNSGCVEFVATFPEFVNPVDICPAPELAE